MTDQLTDASNQNLAPADGVSPTLRQWGTRSWLYLGIALWALAIVTFLGAIAGLVAPLAVAVIMAMLFYPLVDMLETRRVNRSIGSVLVILLVIAIIAGTAWITWTGIFSQSGEMVRQIEAGLVALADWAALNLPASLAEQFQTHVLQALPRLASGIASFGLSSFSGIAAFLFGGFTALFLLFYLLADWHGVSGWVGRHLGLPSELGLALVDDAASIMRIYFYALTLANLPVAVAVGIIMWLLGLPLAVPVALVTLITSYIPYLGAIISAMFAALVALGAGGVTDALIIIGAIIGLQNIIDPIITNHIASDKLEMHPIVTLVTTLGGGILFGALGAMLANPITAVLLDAQKQIQAYRPDLPTGGAPSQPQQEGQQYRETV